MERFLCLSALLVIIHQTYCQEAAIVMYKYSTQDVEVFERWMIEHSKSYDTIEEYEQRLSTFIENLEQIREHNSGSHSWKMGLNQFSDLNFEEFSLLYLGTPQNCSATKSQSVTGAIPPFRKDWREEGDYVTPVKNQGHCGSCWTFSTTGCLESATAIHGKDHQLYSLSEQQLVDCATKFDDFGCNGGLPSHAFEYVKYNKGLESEDDYPYIGEDSDCKFDPSKSKAFVRGVVNITQGDEDSIVGAVGTLNPVSVAFQVTGDFKNYKSGVYSNPTCGKSPSQVNHAVLAVGYDEDEISGKLYWIIKNSWGTDFGIQGYFYMERGSNMCGVATCASYPLVP